MCFKQHSGACELVDKNQPYPTLIPSCATGDTDKCCSKHVRGSLKFCILTQNWSSAMMLEIKLSTEHFPSMDLATIALSLNTSTTIVAHVC